MRNDNIVLEPSSPTVWFKVMQWWQSVGAVNQVMYMVFELLTTLHHSHFESHMTSLVSLNPPEVGGCSYTTSHNTFRLWKKKNVSALWLLVILHSFSILLCNDWAICFSPSWIKYVLLIILISFSNVLPPPPPLNTPSGVQLRLEPIQPCHYLSAACLTDRETPSYYGSWNQCYCWRLQLTQ